MKKGIKKKVLEAVVKIAEFEANAGNANWPPICVGFVHQPKRPKKK